MSVDHILYLTPDDEMAGLRERLRRIQSPVAIVMVPANAPVLRNLANMQLLRRHTDQSDQSIIIVTRDAVTTDLARRQGFAVYSALKRVPAKKRGDLTKEELASIPSLPRVPFYRYFVKLGFFGMSLAVLAGATALIAALAVVLAPTAVITIKPATEPVSVTLDMLASAQIRVIDSAKGQFPARPVQVLLEESGQIATTGVKRAPDATAAGTVVFANRSQNPLTIPKGTIVRTSTGASIRFRTEEEASLMGSSGASVRVPVKAIDPGPNGNVKAGVISIVEGALTFQVSVINDADISGGTEKQVRYVTLQDRTTLRDAIVQKIGPVGYNELRKAIGADDILPEQTISIAVNEVTYDKGLEATGETLGGRVRATVSGLFLDGEILRELAASRLNKQVPGGFIVLPEAVRYSAPSNVVFSDGVISLQMSATAFSQARLSAQEVQRAAAGKTVDDAVQTLARLFPLAQAPDVDLRNAWLGRLPAVCDRLPWCSGEGRLPAVCDRLPWCSSEGRLPLLTSRIKVVIIP